MNVDEGPRPDRYGTAPQDPVVLLGVLNLPEVGGGTDWRWENAIGIYRDLARYGCLIRCSCGETHRIVAAEDAPRMKAEPGTTLMPMRLRPVEGQSVWVGVCKPGKVIYWAPPDREVRRGGAL